MTAQQIRNAFAEVGFQAERMWLGFHVRPGDVILTNEPGAVFTYFPIDEAQPWPLRKRYITVTR